MKGQNTREVIMAQTHSIDFYGELVPGGTLGQVLEVTGSSLDELTRQVRGPSRNSVRVLAAWWMTVKTGLPKQEVAKILKMSTAGVGRAIRRVRSEHVRNPGSEIVSWASQLEEQRAGRQHT